MKTKIPRCIINAPSDWGHSDSDPAELVFTVRHEIDLYEAEEDNDLGSRRNYNAAKRCLSRLEAEAKALHSKVRTIISDALTLRKRQTRHINHSTTRK